MLPSTPKVEAHASNESATSDYCRFAQTVLCLPPMEGFVADFDVGLNKVIVANLMGHIPGLSCMLTVHYGIN